MLETGGTPVLLLHGEIFICVDEAIRQARRFGTIWQSEIVRYLIHGVLHLLGFDDSRHRRPAENETGGKPVVARNYPPLFLAQTVRPA